MNIIKDNSIIIFGYAKSGKSSIIEMISTGITIGASHYIQDRNLIEPRYLLDFPLCRFPVYEFIIDELSHFLSNDVKNFSQMIKRCVALIYVHNSQNKKNEVEWNLIGDIFTFAQTNNPSINLEFFIHQIDGNYFSSELQQTTFNQQIQNEISSRYISLRVSYYLTTINDKRLYEAMSKVLRKLIPHSSDIDEFFNYLISMSYIERGYLIDIKTKLYISSDSGPFNVDNYELCTDILTFLDDIINVYQFTENYTIASIKLDGGSYGEHTIYFSSISEDLVVIFIVKKENREFLPIINHNMNIFKNAMKEITEKLSHK